MIVVSSEPSPQKAPYRLRGTLGWVHEVALVAAGANERDFHEIRKEKTTMAEPLTLPTQGKQQLLEALGALLEQGVALNDAIKSAAESGDQNIPMPEAVTETLENLGMAYMQLAHQFEAQPPLPNDGANGGAGSNGGGGDVQMTAEEKAAVAASAVALSKHFAVRLMKGYRAYKKLEAGAGDGAVDKLLKLAGVTKAKPAKMTLASFMKLHSGAMMKLFELVADLAPMFGAAEEDAGGAAGAGGGAPPPKPGDEEAKKAAEEEEKKKAAASEEEKKKAAAAEEEKKKAAGQGQPGATAKALASIQATLADMTAKVEKFGQRRVPSNADQGTADAGAAAANTTGRVTGKQKAAGEGKYAPGDDISARIAKRRERDRLAAVGGGLVEKVRAGLEAPEFEEGDE